MITLPAGTIGKTCLPGNAPFRMNIAYFRWLPNPSLGFQIIKFIILDPVFQPSIWKSGRLSRLTWRPTIIEGFCHWRTIPSEWLLSITTLIGTCNIWHRQFLVGHLKPPFPTKRTTLYLDWQFSPDSRRTPNPIVPDHQMLTNYSFVRIVLSCLHLVLSNVCDDNSVPPWSTSPVQSQLVVAQPVPSYRKNEPGSYLGSPFRSTFQCYELLAC